MLSSNVKNSVLFSLIRPLLKKKHFNQPSGVAQRVRVPDEDGGRGQLAEEVAGGPQTVHIRVQQPQGPVRKGLLQPDHHHRRVLQRNASDRKLALFKFFGIFSG